MPVYNGGDYFEIALLSALAQDYPEFEIVIVNDGSRDEGHTDEIASRYAAQFPGRIQYFAKANGGVASALNAGIAAMTGDIFCWLSHDDLYVADKLSRQVEFWLGLSNPEAMLISDYELIDPQGSHVAFIEFDHSAFVKSPRLPLYRGAINGCTVFIPKTLLLQEGTEPFNPALKYTQDFDLWRRLIRSADFFHLPLSLVKYRVHPGQDSNKPQSVEEGERLWRTIVDETDDGLKSSLYGSSWRFFDQTHKILESSPYRETAAYLARCRDECLEETLVSVVIPFYNEVDLVRRAVSSVVAQTHQRFELILVSDGSTDDLTMLRRDVAVDARIRLIEQSNSGPGQARNHGLTYVTGDYIAFLDADDMWLPQKLERQLEVMQKAGTSFSHTSYFVDFPECLSSLGVMLLDGFEGEVYPEIIAGCPIACPTVMIHRSVVDQGFLFPDAPHIGEDVLAWIDLALRHELSLVSDPLTIVEWSTTSAALSANKALTGLGNQLALLAEHPLHCRAEKQLASLAAARDSIETRQRNHCGSSPYRFWDYLRAFQEPRLPAIRSDLIQQARSLQARGALVSACQVWDVVLRIHFDLDAFSSYANVEKAREKITAWLPTALRHAGPDAETSILDLVSRTGQRQPTPKDTHVDH